MHAYAGFDPVFRAMDALGQQETDGALGDFCVRCHAPLAVDRGLATTAADLDDVPDHLATVTCVACHRIDEVTGTHNGAVRRAADALIRGGFADPLATDAHDSAYSPLHDRDDPASSEVCIACHDVVLPNGFYLERTGAEWHDSLLSDSGPTRQGCGHCHLRADDAPVATVPDAPVRRSHDHRMAAIDVALTPFPRQDEQRKAIQAELDRTLLASLCVFPLAGGAEMVVRLENAGAGHRFPSGAAHDRRIWVELRAWRGGELVLERGAFADGEPITPTEDDWILHDRAFTAEGNPTHLFWEIGQIEQNSLPMATTLDPGDPDYVHAQERRWSLFGVEPTRAELRVRVRPMGLDLLAELERRAGLDPAVAARMPTLEVESAHRQWSGPLGTCADRRPQTD
jgi:hypothetical protein